MSANYIIAVLSCWKDKLNGTHEAIRKTWGAELPGNWTLRFFLGGSSWIPEQDPEVIEFLGSPGTLAVMDREKAAPVPKHHQLLSSNDEVILDAPDTYLGLSWKGREAKRWVVNNKYDGVFVCMADTYVNVIKLAAAKDILRNQAVAQVFPAGAAKAYPIPKVPCPHGGFGYWLSRPVCEAISNDPVRHYSEDQNVAFSLHAHKIRISPDSRFFTHLGDLSVGGISLHLSTKWHKWDPGQIYDAHRKMKSYTERWPGWDGTCKKCQGHRFTMGLHGPRCRHCGNHFASRP